MALSATCARDLAISAVSFDSLLVRDLLARLETRMDVSAGSAPSIDGLALVGDADNSLLHEDQSRIVVVLAQRLWGYDAPTSADAAVLRGRAKRRRKSMIVVCLDSEPLHAWMTALPRIDLATAGIEGVVEFVLAAVAAAGGEVRDAVTEPQPVRSSRGAGWDTPTPFLDQARAQGGLRREFDAICAELEPGFELKKGAVSDHLLELYKLPHRVIARRDGVGVSFSWLAGRTTAVSEGRLMVIEWKGMGPERGVGAMRTARAVRECVYTPEATSLDNWCWRAESPNGRASSTANLVREWIAGATMSAEAD